MAPAPDRGRVGPAAAGGSFPRRWAYPASLFVMMVGVIVGVTIVVLGIVEFTRDVDRLRRGVTSGEGVVTALEEGEWFVYDEDGAGFGPLDVRVVRVDDGTEIPTSPVTDGPDYDVDGRSGQARVSFQAPTDDRYRVEVGSGVGQVVDFALGRDVGGGRDSAIGRGLLIGGAIFVLGLVWFVLTMIQHARWRVRSGVGDALSRGRDQLRRGADATNPEARVSMYERSAARAEATAERAAAQLASRTAGTPVGGVVDDEIARARAAMADARTAGADAVALDETRTDLLERIDAVLTRAQDRVAAGEPLRDVARDEWSSARADAGEIVGRVRSAADADLAPPPSPAPPPPPAPPAPPGRPPMPAPPGAPARLPPPPAPPGRPPVPPPRGRPPIGATATSAELADRSARMARETDRQAGALADDTRAAGRAVADRLGRELDEAGAGLAADARAGADAVAGEMRAVGDRASAEAGAALDDAAAELSAGARSAADVVNARARRVIDEASADLRAASSLPPASVESLLDRVDPSVPGGPPSGHAPAADAASAAPDRPTGPDRPAPGGAAAIPAAPAIAPPPSAQLVAPPPSAIRAGSPSVPAAAEERPASPGFAGIAPPPAAARSIAPPPAALAGRQARVPGAGGDGLAGSPEVDRAPHFGRDDDLDTTGTAAGEAPDTDAEVAPSVPVVAPPAMASPRVAPPPIAPPPTGRRPDR